LRAQNHRAPHWQKGFFDHIMRSADSYSEKWDYVSANPVRAGLVHHADAWPYQGVIHDLHF
jgi:putative transposase